MICIIGTWTVIVYDASDNSEVTRRTFTLVDLIYPELTLNAPVNYYNSSYPTINFNWTVTDNHDQNQSCNLSIDGVLNVTDIGALNGTPTNYSVSGFSEGLHSWNVSCSDDYNNINYSETRNFTVDTIAPTVTIITPKNKTYNIYELNLNSSVTDVSELDSCWYSLNSAANTFYTCNTAVNITAIEGINNVTVFANDSFGNIGNNSVYFSVNTSQSLDISITYPANGSHIEDPTPLITLLAIDKNFTTIYYTLYIYNENGSLYSIGNTGTLTNNTPTTISLEPALALIDEEATYKIIAVANDSAPTYANSSELVLILQSPIVTLISPYYGYTDSDGDINFTFKFIDFLYTTSNCSLYINGIYNQSNGTTANDTNTTFIVTGIQEDANQYWAVNCTMATDVSAADTYIFHVDQTDPNVTLNSPIDNYNTSTHSINFNWTATNGIDNLLDCNLTIDGVVNVSGISSPNGTPTNYTVHNFLGGMHYWNVTCADDGGRTNTSETRIFTIPFYTNITVFDSKDPVEILEEFVLYANYSYNINNSPIVDASCSFSGDFGIFDDGRMIYFDEDAGTEPNATEAVYGNNSRRYDFINILQGSTTYHPIIKFHKKGQPADNLYVHVRCDGNYTIDNAYLIGNVSPSESPLEPNWTFSIIDFNNTSSPNCSIFVTSPNSTDANNSFHILKSNYTNTPYKRNNGTYYSTDYGQSWQKADVFDVVDFGHIWPSSTMSYNASSGLYESDYLMHVDSIGNHTYNITCTKPSHFPLSENETVTAEDNAAPFVQITLIAPNPAELQTENVTVQWVASDFTLDDYKINVSYPNGTLLTETSLFEFYLTSTQLVVTGNYTLYAWANDSAGLIGNHSTILEVRDTKPPSVTTLVPAQNTTYNNTYTIEIAADVTDYSNIDTVLANITYPNGTIEQITLSNTTGDKYNTSYTIPYLKGQYNITIIANDTFGNTNATETTYFNLIDQTPPLVYLLHPWGFSHPGHYHEECVPVDITVDITDLTEVDTFYANVTFPNQSTSVIVTDFGYGLGSDDFETDTEGTNWEHKNVTSDGQTCFTDIDNSTPGKVHIVLDGGTGPSSARCGYNSLKKPNGNFDVNVSFNISTIEDDGLFSFRSNSDETIQPSGLRVFVDVQKISGTNYYIFGYNNGTTTYQENIPTTDTSGMLRIRRFNMTTTGVPTFNLYYWNNSNSSWVESSFGDIQIPGSLRTQFIQFYAASISSNFGIINITLDDFQISGDNHTFAMFNQTCDTGTYNVSIWANDTLGYVNDTEKSIFEIEEVNDPPSRPVIAEPDVGDIINDIFNITWGTVIDDENHNVRFNITLLNPDGSNNVTLVSNYGDINTTYYEWNTTQHADGLYQIRIVVYENETAEGLYNSDTLAGNFTIDNNPPNVIVIYPLNHTLPQNNEVPLVLNNTDIGMLSSIYANVTTPNGTLYQVFGFDKALQSDDFNNNSINTSWEFRNDSVTPGQTCYADINGTVEGKAFLQIGGSDQEGASTSCGLSSLKISDGDFDMNITFNITHFGNDTYLILRSNNERSLLSAGIRVVSAIHRKVDGSYEYVFAAINSSGLVIINEIPTTDTYGKLRIKRSNVTEGTPVFDLYYWNNTGNNWVQGISSLQMPESERTQFVHIYPESNYGTINATVDSFYTDGDNFCVGIFNYSSQIGQYNVSIFVNDSVGHVNDTETTTFHIIRINTPPSNPQLINPATNSYANNIKNITWNTISDGEGDPLRFNITLLNPNSSINSTIVTEYGDNTSTYYEWNTTGYEDGQYIIRVTVYENDTIEGYSTSGITGLFYVDNTPPSLTIEYPADNFNTSTNTINFNWSVTDTIDNNISCNLIINGTVNATIYSNISTNYSVSNISDGLHYWNVTCTDDGGNANSSEIRIFTVDTTEPSITLNFPVDNYNSSSSSINFNWTATDNLRTDLACNITLDGIVNVTGVSTQNGTPANYTVGNLTDGTHYWNVTCADDLGNVNISETRSFFVDTSFPSLTINAPEDYFNTSSTSVVFNWTASNGEDPVLDCNITVDGVVNVSNKPSPNATPTFQIISNFADGVHYWNISCADDSGNANISDTRTFTVDTQDPSITINAPEDNYNSSSSSIVFNWTAYDGLSNDLSCNITINDIVNVSDISSQNGTPTNYTISSFADGTYYWNISCADNAGNVNTSETRSFRVDTADPNVTLVIPIDYYNTSNVNLTFTCNATNVELTNITLYHNINGTFIANQTTIVSGASAEVSFNVSNIPDGSYVWNCEAYDVVNNNAFAPANRTFTVDTTEPTITLNAPEDNFNSSFPIINLNWTTTDNLDPSLTCNITINNVVNVSNIDSASSTPTNYSILGFADGTYYWNITCWDEHNNTNTSETRSFRVDTADPNVTLVSPIDYYNTSNVNLTFTCNATNVELTNITLYHNIGGSFVANQTIAVSGTTAEVSFNVTNIPDGTYVWNCEAYDDVDNNAFAPENRTFTVDTTEPTITLNAPEDNFTTSSTSVIFNWTASNGQDPVLDCNITVNGVVNVSNKPSPNATPTFQIISNFANGTYYWNVSCADDSGNVNTSETRVFTVDLSQPYVSIISPANNTYDNNGDVMFRYNVTGPLNISNCSLYLNDTIVNTSSSITKGTTLMFDVYDLSEGTYPWYITCTDSLGNPGNSSIYSIIVEYPVNYTNETLIINETIQTANGSSISATIELVDLGSGETDTNTTSGQVANISSGIYNIKITPTNLTIREIFIHNISITENITDIIDLDNFDTTEYDFVSTYAINPKLMGYKSINITVNATTGDAFICSSWNFTSRTCTDDQWQKVGNYQPGQEYILTLYNNFSVAFVEGNMSINLINVDDFLIRNNQTKIAENGSVIDVLLIPENHSIKNITISSHNSLNISNDLKVGGINNRTGWIYNLLLDPTELNFINATINKNASNRSTSVWKCLQYNYSESICYVDHIFIANITPNEIYTIHINTTDPVFFEQPDDVAGNDTFIDEKTPTTNYGTNANLNVDPRTGKTKRAMITWNLSDVPAGVVIESAIMELYLLTDAGAALNTDVVRITQSWSETGVTWNTRPTFDATVYDTILVGGTLGWYSWNITTLVTEWYNGTYTNLGLYVKPTTENAGNANDEKTFYSSDEATLTTLRPKLNITWSEYQSPNVTLNSPAPGFQNDSFSLTNITFNCSVTDNVNISNISLYITNASNESFILNTTTNLSGTSNSTTWNLTLGVGNYTWNCLAYDTSGNSDWGDANRTILLNYTVPDNPPYWSNNQSNVVATYSPSIQSYFNITWEDDFNVSTVWFESNISLSPDNYSMNNITNITYNYSGILPAGTWYWKSYANDTSNQWNETDTWIFTINKATTEINLTLAGNDSNITVEAGSNVLFNVTLTPISGFSYLYEDTTLLYNATTPFSYNKQYTVPGTYVIKANYSGNENYTSATETHNLTVVDTTDPVISIITPLDNDLLGWTIALRANVTDFNLDSIWYEVRNGTVSAAVIDSGSMNNIGGDIYNGTLYTNDSWPYLNSSLNSTNLTFVVYANDSSGNVINASTYWTLDNSKPSIQFITPMQNGSYYNSSFNLEIFLANHLLNYSNYTIVGGQSNSTVLSQSTFTWNDFVNISALADGNYTITVFAQDFVGNNNTKSSWFVVDTIPPVVDETNETGWVPPTPANDSYTNVDTQTFNMTCNDSNGISNVWIDFNGTINSTPTNAANAYWWTFTLAEGTYVYTAYCNDTAGNVNYTETRTVNIDLSAPYWTDNKTSPASGVTYSPGANYQFNITWIDNYVLDTIYFEQNFTAALNNNTPSGSNGNEYYYDVSNLGAGTYVWRSYANDTAGNDNLSDQWTFVVSQATTILTLTPSPGWGVINNTQTNISCTANNAEVNISLYRNGTYVNSSVSGTVSDVQTLAVGTYNYTCNTTGSQNYTAAAESNNLVVSLKNASACSLTFDPVSGQTYPVNLNVTCSCTNPDATPNLYRDGQNVTSENATIVDLAAGTYNYVCNVSETVNWTSATNSSAYTINQAATVVNLTLNGNESNLTLTYPETVTAIFWTNILTSTLYREGADVSSENNTPVVLGVSTYNYTVYNAGNENYTSSFKTFFVTVQQNTSTCTLDVTSSPVVYGTQVMANCSCTNPEETPNLYRDGQNVTSENASYVTLAAADYYYVCNVSSSQNYSSATADGWINVTQATTEINLTLNGNDSNITVEAGSNVLFNVTLTPISGFSYLYEDTTLLNNDTTPFSYNKQYTVPGTYVIKANYSGNENYTSATETHNLTVVDTTDPVISIITPLDNDLLGWTIALRANVTDFNLDSIWYEIRNGTVSAAVIDSGSMNNIGGDIYNGTLYTNDSWPYLNSSLNSTNLTLVVYANDSSGNVINASTYWRLDNSKPSIQFITPMQNGSYYNESFNLEIFLANHLLNYSNYTIVGGQNNATVLSQSTFTWNDFVNISSLADGNYTITVYAQDFVGNNNTKSSWFVVDTIPPVINETNETGWVPPTPENNSYTNVDTQTFNMTCNDSNGISNVWIDFNGTINSTPFNADNAYWWTFTLAEGTYTYTAYCNDTAGNVNYTETRTLNVDLSSPYWTDNKTSPATGVTYSPGANYQFNITWIDNYVLDTIYFEQNFTAALNNDTPSGSNGNEYYYDVSDLAAGTYVWRSYANDTASNDNLTDQWIFVVSKATTVLTLSPDPAWSVINTTQTNISCSANNAEVNISLYRNGTYVNSSVGGTVSDVQTLGVGTYNYTCNTSGSQNYTAAAESNDLIINTKFVPNCSLSFDPVSGQVYPVNLNVSCSCDSPEADASLYRDGANVTYEIDTIVNLAAGNYTYVCNVTETVNYSSATNSSLYTINKNATTINLTLNGNDSNITVEAGSSPNYNVELSPIDGFSYLYEDTTLLKNDTTPFNFSKQYTTTGVYAIKANYSGNENYTSSSETHYLTVQDTTDPTVSVYVNDTSVIYGIEGVFIDWNVSDYNIDYTIINITYPNGTLLYSSTNASIDIILDPSNLTAIGQYNITIYANDTSGNSNITYTSFTVIDNVNPLIEFVSPTPSNNTNTNIQTQIINVTHTESFPDTLTIVIDGVVNQTINYTGPYTNISITFPEGTHTYNITINDTTGNFNYTETRTIIVDLSDPAISLNLNDSTLEYGVENVLIDWNITDLYINSKLINITYPNNTVLTISTNDLLDILLTPSNLTTLGNYTITLFGNDTAGNNDTLISNFTVSDTTPPSVFDVIPTNSSYFKQQDEIEIGANVTDLHSIVSVFANITLDNGTLVTVPLSYTSGNKYNASYTIPEDIGVYNITIYANDSTGNLGNSTQVQIDILTRVIFNVSVIDANSSGVNSTWTAYYQNDTVAFNSSQTGNYSQYLPDLLLNFRFYAHDDDIRLDLNGINVSQCSGKVVGIDEHNEHSEYLITYGLTSECNFSSATLYIYYDDVGYSNEDYLQLHTCSNYNFSQRICNATYVDISSSSTQNKSGNYFSTTVTSFSAFSVKQSTVPSGGSGGGGRKKIEECRDKKDNDGDGLVDYPEDPGCVSRYDPLEYEAPIENCTENWMCVGWDECIDGLESRVCFDVNRCGTEESKPATDRECEIQVPEPEPTLPEEEKPEEIIKPSPVAPKDCSWIYIFVGAHLLLIIVFLLLIETLHLVEKKENRKLKREHFWIKVILTIMLIALLLVLQLCPLSHFFKGSFLNIPTNYWIYIFLFLYFLLIIFWECLFTKKTKIIKKRKRKVR
ncbi:Ig-like domain-containing protein [Nanoarchaeota archaeon]